MRKVKPHCSICMKEMIPTDEVVLTEQYFFIHDSCSEKNPFDEKDKGPFYKVATRHFTYFQRFVHDFNQMGYYKKK